MSRVRKRGVINEVEPRGAQRRSVRPRSHPLPPSASTPSAASTQPPFMQRDSAGATPKPQRPPQCSYIKKKDGTCCDRTAHHKDRCSVHRHCNFDGCSKIAKGATNFCIKHGRQTNGGRLLHVAFTCSNAACTGGRGDGPTIVQKAGVRCVTCGGDSGHQTCSNAECTGGTHGGPAIVQKGGQGARCIGCGGVGYPPRALPVPAPGVAELSLVGFGDGEAGRSCVGGGGGTVNSGGLGSEIAQVVGSIVVGGAAMLSSGFASFASSLIPSVDTPSFQC